MPYAPMASRIETERLVLVPIEEWDLPELTVLVGERRARPVPARDRGWLAGRRAEEAANGFGCLAVRRREDGEMLGYCGLVVGRSSVAEPEIAYELLRRHHGHGYATEAAAAVVGAAAATGRTRLWSTVRAWNAPSLRVLEKIAFRRDHVVTDDDGEIVYLVRDLP